MNPIKQFPRIDRRVLLSSLAMLPLLFASLRSTGDYQAAVPLTGYDDYAGSVDAIGAGQSRVLTADA